MGLRSLLVRDVGRLMDFDFSNRKNGQNGHCPKNPDCPFCLFDDYGPMLMGLRSYRHRTNVMVLV